MHDEYIRHELLRAQFHAADASEEGTAPMIEVAGVETTISLERPEPGITRVVVAVSVEEAAPWLQVNDTIPLTVEINGKPVFQG